MKYLLFFVCIALIPTHAFSQLAREVKIKYEKDTVTAVAAEYEQDEETITKSFERHFEKLDFPKGSKDNGYRIYKNVSWPEVSPEKLDVYLKIDGGRKKTIVTILLSRSQVHFIASSTESATLLRLSGYLNNFKTHVTAYQLATAIALQEQAVTKASNEHDDAKKQVKDAHDEKERLEKKLAGLDDDQDNKRKTLEQEQKKLELLKGQQVGK